MKTMKYALILGLAAVLAPFSHAALVDFHFGAVTQNGAAAIGSASDRWNAANTTNGGPVLLQDTTGAATPISVTWTSGDAWGATKAIFSDSSSTATAMDPATTWLMESYADSYQYGTGPTNLVVCLAGLAPSQAYTLVLYGSGNTKNEGTAFTVTGAATYTGATSGLNRKLSSGAGVAYTSIPVVSSAAGTLRITTLPNGDHFAIINGFQLLLGPVAATDVTVAASGSAAGATTNSAALSPITWGVNGHPFWSDYASWIPANVTTQMNYLKQLGCTYYRVPLVGTDWYYLDNVVPAATAAGVTLLPYLPVNLVAASSAQTNYNTNYSIGYNWATYAISKGYAIPYWELGNEVEGWGLVSVTYDGASPNDFPDKVPGGFVAIASGLTGAYQGIKDAYTAGRKSGATTITPQVLIGATYRHWGLLSKIQAYDNGSLPCDLISWHWYGPNYGAFNLPINDPLSASNGRTPAQCLGDFKSHTNPTQPMDIWITETDRSQIVNGQYVNGSVSSNATPKTSQDWTAQATAIQTCIDSFKTVPSVKGIFVYELLDEPLATSSTVSYLASEGYFGLVTGLNGTPKNAFYTFQAEIKAGR